MTLAMPSEHMKDLLVTKGYRFKGTNSNSLDWDIWIGKQPNEPDRAITIYDSGGQNLNPRWLLDYPTVQVRVRGGQGDYAVAGNKAKEIQNLLVGQESYTAANTDRIVHVNALGDVGFVGWGDKDRPEFVFNLRLIIEPYSQTASNRESL